MFFPWSRRRRRKKLLASPFPEAWEPILRELPFYEGLEDDERARLRDTLRVLVAEKDWEGCGGLDLTERRKVLVAAQAALLTLGVPHEYYRDVQTILVYPDAFVPPGGRPGPGGIVTEGTAYAGEAWPRGPVILSWRALERGMRHPEQGKNLVFHEFAHKLDMLDGYADGTPPLSGREAYETWRRVMTEEHGRLVEAVERGQRAAVLDLYGATNPAEFFAVATEAFFQKPIELRREHASLYETLASYYRQDPAARVASQRSPRAGRTDA